MNTTETCLTLKDLRSATRYIVYVTASNKFGMSVPSTRALATTNAIASSSNTSLPEIERISSILDRFNTNKKKKNRFTHYLLSVFSPKSISQQNSFNFLNRNAIKKTATKLENHFLS